MNSSGDGVRSGSTYGSAMRKMSHVVKLVRANTALAMPWGMGEEEDGVVVWGGDGVKIHRDVSRWWTKWFGSGCVSGAVLSCGSECDADQGVQYVHVSV
jgi:hypothetical protein